MSAVQSSKIAKKFVHACCQPYGSVDGATALHIACLIGNFELADVLLKAGADWNIKDDSDRTPHDYVLVAHGGERDGCLQEDVRGRG